MTATAAPSNYSVKYKKNKDGVIETATPIRPKEQKSVLAHKVDPIKKVRVAFIGMGMRGPSHLTSVINTPGTEVVAVCDLSQKNCEKANAALAKAGLPAAKLYYNGPDDWKNLLKLDNIDLVIISTDWKTHATMAIQAMKDGKHVALEVPAAMTMKEIWDLINVSEQTRKHCIQIENCVYDFFELTTLNMIQEGVFGEVIHAEGAYIHNLEQFWKSYWNNWRLDYNIHNRGDVYATHGMGPACFALDIHRGDKMNYLVAVDTKPTNLPIWLRANGMEKEAEMIKNGDKTLTLIKTEKGKTIHIQHDIAAHRPYSRMYMVQGTKAFANKYPTQVGS